MAAPDVSNSQSQLNISEDFFQGDIRKGLERMRLRLLDLTARNRLLNFRHTKKGALRVVDELPNQLFQSLLDGKELYFHHVPRPRGIPRPEEEALDPENGSEQLSLDPRPQLRGEYKYPSARETAEKLGIATSFELPLSSSTEEPADGRHSDRAIQTLHYPEELEAILRSISSAARLAIEETGTNMLFLVSGFLEWFESDDSRQARLSPLLLLPASVQREAADPVTHTYRYSIRYSGEDLQSNISLQERLRNDFGVLVPDLSDGELPESYFNRLTPILHNHPRWRLHRSVTLTLLSFGKLLMYRDLDPKTWPERKTPADHPRIREFFEGIQRTEHSFAVEHSLDDPAMQQRVPAIVDNADSSQHSALVDAMDGRNLVIEGPPGTGKSQTIANLIAAALARGKTILFVSEKLAALEVVRHRLDKVGLGDFCLELHSHKTQKRMLLEDVARRLQRRRTFSNPANVDEKKRILERDRDALTAYSILINKPYGAVGRPLHESIWKAQRHRSALTCDPVVLDRVVLDGVRDLTLEQIDERRQRVSRYSVQLQEIVDVASSVPKHPWYGATDAGLNFTDVDRIGDLAADAGTSVQHLLELCVKIDSSLPSPWLPLTLDSLDAVRRAIADLPATVGDVHEELLLKLRDPNTRRALTVFIELVRKFWNLVRELGNLAEPMVLLTHQGLDESRVNLRRGIELAPGATSVGELQKASACAEKASTEIRHCDDIRVTINTDLTTQLELTTNGVRLAEIAIDRVGKLPSAELRLRHDGLNEPCNSSMLRPIAAEAKDLVQSRLRLEKKFDLAMLPGIPQLKDHVDAVANGRWWNKILRQYRQALRTYRAMRRDSTTVAQDEVLEDLRELLRFADRRKRFEEDLNVIQVGGPFFRGIDTPFNQMVTLVEWREETVVCLRYAGRAGADLAVRLWATATEVLQQLKARRELVEWQQSLKDLHQTIVAALSFVSPNRTVSASDNLGAVAEQLAAIAAELKSVHAALTRLQVPDALRLTDAENFLRIQGELLALLSHINSSAEIVSVLGEDFRGPETDLGKIIRSLEYYRRVADARLPIQLTEWLLSKPAQARLDFTHESAATIARSSSLVRAKWHVFQDATSIDRDQWFGIGLREDSVQLLQLLHRLQRALDAKTSLPGWLDYLRARQEIISLGLATLVGAAEADVLAPSDLSNAFEFISSRCLVQEALKDHTDLTRFSGLSHEKVRERFARMDTELMVLAREQTASIADQRYVPIGNGYGPVSSYTDLELLEREVQKQKRHLPIRQLIRRAGAALLGLKPCFMMGPLSVAQYLPPGRMEFDLVVMDEASQLRPEDALGAIGRATQVVVVGDRMQLPPTSFFDRLEEESDVNETEDAAAAQALVESESILDIASAVYKPARMLRWHYRSKHASLIAFSNREYYENRLVAFPSPNAKSPALGVKFIHVRDGVYESRQNLREARRVVATAMRHMRERPEESLGIVTLNSVQRDLVESILEQQLKSDPEAQKYIESRADALEPFFVKNLENVQGDERDVIYISVTYGPTATGQVFQRFGPINGPMGHRRLNVLFTRARLRVVLFSSLLPEQIVAGPQSTWGLRALKGYLQYAQTGHLDHATPSGREPDSEFEVEVAEALRKRGYETVAQVGMAGYFVDLAVLHPTRADTFVLGVECDGKTYHSSVTARDRDRLRQTILEDLGWRIHRVWSTDWFKASAREVDRLVARIETILAQESLQAPTPEESLEGTSDTESSTHTQLHSAIEANGGWHGEIESQPLSPDEVRAALLEMRAEIERDLPSGDQATSLLREEMLDALVREKPRSKEEWLKKVPLDLRLNTDGPQVAAYLSRILELTSQMAAKR